MTRALVIGEALVDIVDGHALPGGSPLNVAVGLGRLGSDVTLATRIGADHHGETIRQHLEASSVQLSADAVGPGSTSTAVAAISPSTGAAEYEFDIHWDLRAEGIDDAECDILHAGSLGAYLEPGCQAVEAAMHEAAPRSLVSFDPNIRPALLEDRAAVVRRTERLASMSDVVKLSDADAEWLYPGDSIERVLSRLAGLGPRLVVITRGGDGYTAASGDRTWFRHVAVPVSVADTIGAGDAFMSGLLHAVGDGGLVGRVRGGDMTVDEWRTVLDIAQRSAGLTVSRAGADPPWASELFPEGSQRRTTFS